MGLSSLVLRNRALVPITAAAYDLIDTNSPVLPTLKMGLLLALVPSIPALLIYHKKSLLDVPWLYKVAWVAAFVLNVIAVSYPGRFDSMRKWEGGIPWESYFEPSTWAFSIWGAIYCGELLATLYIAAVGEPMNSLKKVVPFWVAGNLFQALWCVAFRPDFEENLWLSTSLLTLATISFGLCHDELTASIRYLSSAFNSDSRRRLMLLRIPIALHLAWIAAASLVNGNLWLAVSRVTMDTQLVAGFLSAYGAASIGAVLAWRSRDPIIALTAAWALAALSDRTRQKSTAALVAEGSAMSSREKGFFGRAQGTLATTEKVLSYVLLVLGVGIAIPQDMF